MKNQKLKIYRKINSKNIKILFQFDNYLHILFIDSTKTIQPIQNKFLKLSNISLNNKKSNLKHIGNVYFKLNFLNQEVNYKNIREYYTIIYEKINKIVQNDLR